MTLQAYIDESIEEDGVFVLAGCIADIESWVGFSKEWEDMLPYGLQDDDGDWYFKMSHMRRRGQGAMERVPAFFKIIEKNVFGFVSAKIDISELKRAQSRIIVPEAINPIIDWGRYANPYYIAFRCLMDKFHIARHENEADFPIKEPIDFIFDERTDAEAIMVGWSDYIKNRKEEVKKYYGATPVFKNDREFLPLQAADLYAWWVRKWYMEGTPEKIRAFDFGAFTREEGVRKHLVVDIAFNEENLVKNLMQTVRLQIGSDYAIYDVNVS